MTLRRGFKAQAERLAAEQREELQLRVMDRLDPWRLAEHLAIPVLTLAQFEDRVGSCEATRFFRSEGVEVFSAVTVSYGGYRVIVHNDGHAPTRQASNLAHELSHTLLEHPASGDLSPRGCAQVDASIEEEADWLMGVLLVPRAGALWLARQGHDVVSMAQHFGVSESLCKWRVQATAIMRQVKAI